MTPKSSSAKKRDAAARKSALTVCRRERMASKYDAVAKIAVVGPIGAGKTSLIQALCHSAGDAPPAPTFGVDFRLHTMAVDDKQLRLHLWDTTGAARFASITHAYYRVAEGIVVCYDATDPAALDHVGEWCARLLLAICSAAPADTLRLPPVHHRPTTHNRPQFRPRAAGSTRCAPTRPRAPRSSSARPRPTCSPRRSARASAAAPGQWRAQPVCST